MGKKAYVGISDKARNAVKIYIGAQQGMVGNTARRVVKGYVGDENNIARQFWPPGNPVGDWLKDRMYLNEVYEAGQSYNMEYAPFEDVLGYAVHKLAYLSYGQLYHYGDYEHIENKIQNLVNSVVSYCESNRYTKDRYRNNPIVVGAGFTGSSINYQTLYVEVYMPKNANIDVSNVQILNKTKNYEGIEYYETSIGSVSCIRVFGSVNIDGGTSGCSQITENQTFYVGRQSWYKIRENEKSYGYAPDVESYYFPLYYIQVCSLGANFDYIHYFEDKIYYKWDNFGRSIYDLTDDIMLVDTEHATIQNNGIALLHDTDYVELPNNVYGRTDCLIEIEVNEYNIQNPVDGAILISFWRDNIVPQFMGLRWYQGEWKLFNVRQNRYDDDSTGITDINYFSGKKIGITRHSFVYKERPLYDQYWHLNQHGIRLYVNRRLVAESYYIPAPLSYDVGVTMMYVQSARRSSQPSTYQYDRWYLGSPNKQIGTSFDTYRLSIKDVSFKSLYLYHGIPEYKYNIDEYQTGQTYTFNLADMEEVWDYAVYAYLKIQEDYGTGSWLYKTPLDILNSGTLKSAVFDKIKNYSVDFNAITINILGSGIDRSGSEDSSYVTVRIILDRLNSVQGTILEKSSVFGFDYCKYQYVTSHRYYMEARIRVSASNIETTITNIGTSTNGNVYIGVYGYEGAGGSYYPYMSLSNIGLDLLN